MHPYQVPNGPVFEGPYVPYFYQAGLYRSRPLPADRPNTQPSGSPSRYDFSGQHTSIGPSPYPQTVEGIVAQGYFAVPQGDLESALISDKKETSWLGLDDVIRQVRHRYAIYEANMYQIELGKCYAMSSLFGLIAYRGGVRADSRETYGLDKGLREFYEQQRDERVKLWQDVSRLKQSLPEAAQQYLASYRKLAILEDERGDAP